MATVRWTVATGVAFPQKSESILAHHFKKRNDGPFWPTTSKRADGYGGLAQLGERLPCKQEVSGSIPLISTTKKRLTEIPKEFEVSLSLLKKKLNYAP